MTSAAAIGDRLAVIRAELAEIGRNDVRIVAVTKGFDSALVIAAREAGLTDIGESYAQELLEKSDALAGSVVHFIGRIQRNKVRKIAQLVDLWHSVARPEIIDEIAKRRPQASILIQMNPSSDPTKDGVAADELKMMLERAEGRGIEVRGLMTIGVLGDREATRRAFAEVVELADQYGLPERSMGMSNDYLDAAAAGATMLRLGSSLFGPRPS